MTPTYTYTNSADYINGLSFDYIETYSFQRCEEYEQNLKVLQAEYDRLKARKEHSTRLTTDEEQRYADLHRLAGFTQYLIDDEGRFHPSRKRTNIFQHDDPVVDRIKQILRTEIEEIPMWMCAPIYRDALVFYDQDNHIVSTLNVCLSCQYMETKKFHHINADYKTYDLFKKLFLEIGHDVEDPTYSVAENMEKLKQKYK